MSLLRLITARKSGIVGSPLLFLDAGNTASYPGTGTIWTDLSGNAYNGDLLNGVGYDTAHGGSLVFDGHDDVGVVISNIPAQVSNGDHTLIAFINPGNKPENDVISNGTIAAGDILLMVYNQKVRGHAWTTTSANVIDDPNLTPGNNWVMITQRVTWNDKIALFVNGVLKAEQSIGAAPTSTRTSLGIGWRLTSNPVSHFLGKIAVVLIYSRALGNSEIQQNFNALRGRFGI